MCVLVTLALAVAAPIAFATGYDPFAAPEGAAIQPLDLTVQAAARGRDVPIRVYWPAATTPLGPRPVVLFSHGLGGSREGCAYLGRHWAARGYVAVFLQHPGSDASVWRDRPAGERRAAMEEAASAQNFLLRVKDVSAVLDQLGRWNGEGGHPLARRLDLTRVGMSGHSFGAVTTQAVSGQSFGIGASFADRRIKAALVLSPSSPRRGDPARAFASVDRPWMLMTGTKDIAPIGDADTASRLAVFPALPPSAKYELVLEGAEHSAFTEHALPGDREPRNPNHHRVVLALSTAFWDAFLRGDEAARAWLDGAGPAALLQKGDRWQRK
jgi:predicted dienelactone hydrolase